MIAFLFPGQGAQYPGMGKDFVASYTIARETFEEADDLLERHLSKIILQGPDDTLTETKNSQTAIFVLSVAILRVVCHLFPNLRPTFAAGLSLGEYTALVAAGYLSFENGLKLVDHRACFMNEACEKHPGTMAVVLGLDGPTVEEICHEIDGLWAANFNCPGQVVISGTKAAVQKGAEFLKDKAKRILPLTVHGAFHSGLMQEAEDLLTPYIRKAPFEKSGIPLVMNVTGESETHLDLIRQNLIHQVTHPVRWEKGIHTMWNMGVKTYIEMGPGKTLAGFNKRIGVGHTLSIEHIVDIKALEEALC